MTRLWKDELPQEKEGRYHTGDEWRSNASKMKGADLDIIAYAVGGMPVEHIAAAYGVSQECIWKRIRPLGLTKGRGRPKKDQPVKTPLVQFRTEDNQLSCRAVMLSRRCGSRTLPGL